MAKRYRLKERSRINNKKTVHKPDSIIQNNVKIQEYYEKYYHRIETVCSNTIACKCNMHLNGAKEIGAEIASDVFTVLCEKYSTVNEEYIYTWLYKVAQNLINNFIRKYFAQKRHLNISIDDETQRENITELSVVPEEYDIEEIREKFLRSLTPDELKEYELYFCSDKSLKEIARESNIKYTAVRQRKSRLLAILKKKLLALLYIF